jgi:hypothetical protein
MSDDEAMAADGTEPDVAFERQDAPARGVAYAILGLFAGIAISAIFVGALLHGFEAAAPKETGAASIKGESLAPNAPLLEVSPGTDAARVEAQAQHMLDGYAWVDRSAGLARIPIDRAMELTAKQGWPDEQRKAGP